MRPEALDQRRSLIERIIVMPSDARIEIEPVGEIAHDEAFRGGREPHQRTECDFYKVVAGNRRHRDETNPRVRSGHPAPGAYRLDREGWCPGAISGNCCPSVTKRDVGLANVPP